MSLRDIFAGIGVVVVLWMVGVFALGYAAVSAVKNTPFNSGVEAFKVKSDHAVGVVELTGEIMTSRKFEKALDGFLANDRIKAIVVRIDTPGGSAGASEEIQALIKRADSKKPVVCSMGSIAASGGIYSAMGCRKIVANAATITGSIGVIMMSPNVAGIMEKLGVKMLTVKSGALKDAGSPFREPTEQDLQYLQAEITRSYEQFVNVIAAARKLPAEEVKKFADGRIILGEEAKRLGLIDEIGTIYTAAGIALKEAGDDGEPELVRKGPSSVWGMLQDLPDSETLSSLSNLIRGGLYYR
jgi:protease-4